MKYKCGTLFLLLALSALAGVAWAEGESVGKALGPGGLGGHHC